MIAHPFDVFVVSFNTIIKFLHKFLMLVAIVNRSATQTECDNNFYRLLMIQIFFNYVVHHLYPGLIPENETYAISVGRFYLIK